VLYGRSARDVNQAGPVVNKATASTVRLQITEPVLSGLYNIKQLHSSVKQGTLVTVQWLRIVCELMFDRNVSHRGI
jgi:hypothetical protein